MSVMKRDTSFPQCFFERDLVNGYLSSLFNNKLTKISIRTVQDTLPVTLLLVSA